VGPFVYEETGKFTQIEYLDDATRVRGEWDMSLNYLSGEGIDEELLFPNQGAHKAWHLQTSMEDWREYLVLLHEHVTETLG
jgi:hypothetical protein